jgi:hypothetical protein
LGAAVYLLVEMLEDEDTLVKGAAGLLKSIKIITKFSLECFVFSI